MGPSDRPQPGPRPLLVRVDNRLVHGQILAAWIPQLGARALAVIDDEAAQNTLVRSAMSIAVGPEVKLTVHRIEAAARAVTEPGTLVLLRDVADAVRARDKGLPLEALTVGNVHFTAGRRAITPSVYLSESEVDLLATLEREGTRVEIRTLPLDPPITLADIRRSFERAAG